MQSQEETSLLQVLYSGAKVESVGDTNEWLAVHSHWGWLQWDELRSDAAMKTHHDKSSACATLCCNFSNRVREDNSFSWAIYYYYLLNISNCTEVKPKSGQHAFQPATNESREWSCLIHLMQSHGWYQPSKPPHCRPNLPTPSCCINSV